MGARFRRGQDGQNGNDKNSEGGEELGGAIHWGIIAYFAVETHPPRPPSPAPAPHRPLITRTNCPPVVIPDITLTPSCRPLLRRHVARKLTP